MVFVDVYVVGTGIDPLEYGIPFRSVPVHVMGYPVIQDEYHRASGLMEHPYGLCDDWHMGPFPPDRLLRSPDKELVLGIYDDQGHPPILLLGHRRHMNGHVLYNPVRILKPTSGRRLTHHPPKYAAKSVRSRLAAVVTRPVSAFMDLFL